MSNRQFYKTICIKCKATLIFELVDITDKDLGPSYKITPDKSSRSYRILPLDTLPKADSCQHKLKKENKMPTKLLDPDHPTCPACGTDNIFEDSGGWWYCNDCGEVWEEEE